MSTARLSKIGLLGVVAALFMLINSSPISASSADPTAQSDIGRVVCGKFLETSPQDAAERFRSWTEGFIIGKNAERISTGQPFVNLEAPGQDAAWRMATIRSFCEGHPLVAYQEAVQDLFQQMGDEQHEDSVTPTAADPGNASK